MTRLTYHQILVKNLEGTIRPDQVRVFMTKEQALAELRQLTGQDFGNDVDAWKKWLGRSPSPFKQR